MENTIRNYGNQNVSSKMSLNQERLKQFQIHEIWHNVDADRSWNVEIRR